jgi:glutathione S-transferase
MSVTPPTKKPRLNEEDEVLKSVKKLLEKKKEKERCDLSKVEDADVAIQALALYIGDLQSEAGGAFISIAASYDNSPKNKKLEKRELKTMLDSLHVLGYEKLLPQLRTKFDTDKDGKIDYFDFVRTIRRGGAGREFSSKPQIEVPVTPPLPAPKEPDYTVHWSSGSGPAWRVLLTLEYLSTEYSDRFVYKPNLLQLDQNEHKTEEMLQLNPRGKVPILQDHRNNIALFESLAIMHYIVAMEDTKHVLVPPSKHAAAYAQTIVRFYESEYMHSAVYKVMTMAFREGKRREDIPEEVLEAVESELKRWNAYLDGSSYVAGDQLTIADLAVFPFIATLDRIGHTFSNVTNVKRYFKSLVDEAFVQRTWPPHWKEKPGKKIFL